MFTSYQTNGHSVVDYAIATNTLLCRVNSFMVGHLIGDISDYAPITITLQVRK